jgi:uncharacterized protein (DUF849 family)
MSSSSGAALSRAFARAAAVGGAAPAIITCAVSGGVVTGNPNQPMTREETVAAALEAARAGAAVVHVHARSIEGGMSSDAADYAAIGEALRDAGCDALLNVTTDGEGLEEGSVPASLAAQPDLATLVCGSTRFGPGDLVIGSSQAALERLAGNLRAAGVAPEYECFDLGMVAGAGTLAAKAQQSGGMVHLIAGSLAGLPAVPGAVLLLPQLLPAEVPWAVSSISDHFRTMALSLALGGHARTGLEDVVYTAPGEHATSNGELVERARSLCDAIGRPVADVAQAREILGLTDAAV